MSKLNWFIKCSHPSNRLSQQLSIFIMECLLSKWLNKNDLPSKTKKLRMIYMILHGAKRLKRWMWFHYQEMKVKWQCRTEKKRSGPAEYLVLNKMLCYYLLIIQFIKYSYAVSYCFIFMITSFIRKVSVYVCPHLDWGPALTFAVIINLLIKFEVFILFYFLAKVFLCN